MTKNRHNCTHGISYWYTSKRTTARLAIWNFVTSEGLFLFKAKLAHNTKNHLHLDYYPAKTRSPTLHTRPILYPGLQRLFQRSGDYVGHIKWQHNELFRPSLSLEQAAKSRSRHSNPLQTFPFTLLLNHNFGNAQPHCSHSHASTSSENQAFINSTCFLSCVLLPNAMMALHSISRLIRIAQRDICSSALLNKSTHAQTHVRHRHY